MTFRVGMKVRCIKRGSWEPLDPGARPCSFPHFGGEYTVAWVSSDVDGTFLGLAEFDPFISWCATRFRPAVSPKVEISFTTGADPDSEQYDNRRRIPVSEWGCSA